MTKEIRKMQHRSAKLRVWIDEKLLKIQACQQRLDELADEHEDLAFKIAVARLIEIEKREQAEKAVKQPKSLREKYHGNSSTNRRKIKMATSRALANALDQQEIGVRRQYAALADEQKAEVGAAFRRHFVACLKSGVPVEPGFLRETLMDMRAGIHESVGEAVQKAFAAAGGIGDAEPVIIR